MNNSSVEYHSHHYLIGKRLSKDSSMKIKDLQTQLQNQYSFLTPVSRVQNIYTPFLYLGYLSESVEPKLKNLVSPQLFSLGEDLSSHRLYLNGYTFTGQSNSFKYLGLTYEDPENAIENVIIPYLKSYLDVYTEMNLLYENIPMIPLFRLNNNMQKQFLQENQNKYEIKEIGNRKYPYFNNISLPNVKYDKDAKKKFVEFDSIELLRATPIKIKKGKKSFNEQLAIDSILSIPLAGNL
jgi:hypothetical protein